MNFEDQMILAVREAWRQGKAAADSAATAYMPARLSHVRAEEILDHLAERDSELLEDLPGPDLSDYADLRRLYGVCLGRAGVEPNSPHVDRPCRQRIRDAYEAGFLAEIETSVARIAHASIDH